MLSHGAGEGIRTLDPNLGKTAAVWRRLSLCLEVPDDCIQAAILPSSVRSPAARHALSAP